MTKFYLTEEVSASSKMQNFKRRTLWTESAAGGNALLKSH